MDDPIRIFVGCSANGEDAEAAMLLEYTLRKHASKPLLITWMMLSRDVRSPWYSEPLKKEGWNTAGWATPFSAFRFAVPHVCGYKGRAIYLDVDMLAMADIAELWGQEIPSGKAVLTKDAEHLCVVLFDCRAAASHLPAFEALRRTPGLYRQARKNLAPVMAPFNGEWNCRDGERFKSIEDPAIKILHFTEVPTQPHLKWAVPRLAATGQRHWNNCKARPHPRADVQPLVDRLYAEAIEAGYKVENYIPADPFGSYDSVRGGRPAKAA